MKINSVHKQKLRFRRHTWQFELGQEFLPARKVELHDRLISTLTVTHQRPHQRQVDGSQQVTFYNDNLPAIISFLRRALQELREKQKQQRSG